MNLELMNQSLTDYDITEWKSIYVKDRYGTLYIRNTSIVWFKYFLNKDGSISNELPHIIVINDYQNWGSFKEKYNIRLYYNNYDDGLISNYIDKNILTKKNYQYNSLKEAIDKADIMFLHIKKLFTLRVFI